MIFIFEAFYLLVLEQILSFYYQTLLDLEATTGVCYQHCFLPFNFQGACFIDFEYLTISVTQKIVFLYCLAVIISFELGQSLFNFSFFLQQSDKPYLTVVLIIHSCFPFFNAKNLRACFVMVLEIQICSYYYKQNHLSSPP